MNLPSAAGATRVSRPPQATDGSGKNRGQERPWLFGLLLVAAVVFAYAPVWKAGFIWDDDVDIIQNCDQSSPVATATRKN